ncbi:GNAT family N-acetyltransferase [Lentisphaera profundi]|uniref:GNAT family N-acetyltransferase n=1 Tax=Lentisphaera profundi TaxID=1658616 RepID=A0ABY7VYE8_9BACT|nr:bifunctional acetyl-CoA hydrolase/transferase family protein/GNAT family N-acetyltransferase [Lentisphaera profundi]WDE99291.1 GNAT family N-acetyltransferase [Lentisphaera profundi]
MIALEDKDWGQYIRSGYRIFFGSGAACPQKLIQRFLDNSQQFNDIELTHILTLGETPWTDEKYKDHLRVNSFFLGPGTRDAVSRGDGDYTPCFLSEIPSLMEDKIHPIDVAFIQVTPPDEYGFCSFGVSVDVVSVACRTARYVIAEINPRMPKTLGQSFIHVSKIDAFMEVNYPIMGHGIAKLDEVTLKIGKYCAMLIEDGSTLQMGIGKIPDAVLSYLGDRSDLGIHTEMFSDGLLDLYKNGNITNAKKAINRFKTVTSFCFGSEALYDFVHDNPHVEFHPSEYTNRPAIIAQNPKVISINSAIQIDLSGQVVADSIGDRFYSGIGGQVDFIRGAGMSLGGKPIIALPSTAKGGEISRIVAVLSQGSGVVTSRGDVHYVVTEYGIATLRGRSIRERALELIQVAHPKFRDELLAQVREHYWVPPYHQSMPKSLAELKTTKMKISGRHYNLRALQSSDQRRLQEFFYSHTEKTLMNRYRAVPKNMPTDSAYRLVNIDQSRDAAICLVQRQGPREIIRGVGRFYMENEERAEISFVVGDDLQGEGLGSVLMKTLIKIATERKIKILVAYVINTNYAMQHLLEKFNFSHEESGDASEFVYVLELNAK